METIFTNPLLTINIVLIAGALAIYTINERRVELIRRLALYLSLVALAIGVVSCLSFNQAVVGFQFLWKLDVAFLNNLTFTLGADGLTMIFLLLTLFVFPFCFAAAWSVTRGVRSFYMYLLAMEILLVVTFTTLDLFYFYVFFESLLIPMFILIGIWGARERKIKAAYLFFLYTLFGSLIMLFGVLYLYLITGSTNYFVLLNTVLEPEQQKLIWVCFFMAFAVKMPLFPFHIWLPEAHVEAPTVGSMLLASLLLKLGGYGFLRFSLTLLQEGSAYFSAVVSTLALLGVVYGSLATIRQIDLKRIIAYSSVAHMNLVMLGLFSGNQQGIEGAIYLMVGHGVVSTALFFCVGVLYDRYHSRLLRYYGGLVTTMPVFSFFLFSFTLANMSFPGTSNFLGELLLFLGVYANNSAVLLFSTAGIVLSAVYSVWLYNRIVFGTLKTTYISRFMETSRRETAILAALLLAMIALGITADFILTFLHFPVAEILSGNTPVDLLGAGLFGTIRPNTGRRIGSPTLLTNVGRTGYSFRPVRALLDQSFNVKAAHLFIFFFFVIIGLILFLGVLLHKVDDRLAAMTLAHAEEIKAQNLAHTASVRAIFENDRVVIDKLKSELAAKSLETAGLSKFLKVVGTATGVTLGLLVVPPVILAAAHTPAVQVAVVFVAKWALVTAFPLARFFL